MKKNEKLRDLAILIIISGFVLLWNLGTGSLLSWDEAVYAQVSKEMLHSHNYIDLTWAGRPWSDKPPLYMWMTVIFYKIFGVGEFAARLFSALCGIGTVIVTYLFAYKLYSRRAAFAAGLILVSTLHFIWSSKVGMLDSSLTFFISLSLYWFIIGMERKRYLFFSMLAFGCAFLTKSFGALLIPIILFIYVIFSKKPGVMREPALWAGFLMAIFIVALWHFMAFTHYGKGFVTGYFTKHLFARVTQLLDNHTGTIFTYFKVIQNKGRPWGIVAFFVIPLILWEIFKKKGKTNHALPLIWVFTAFIVFSMVKTKLQWYIVPVYPALAMLIGSWISAQLKSATVFAAVIAAAASLVYLTVEKGIFNLDYSREVKNMSLSINDKVPKDEKIFLYDDDPSLRFYLLDRAENLEGTENLNNLLSKKGTYIVMSTKTLSTLPKPRFSIITEISNFVVVQTS